MSKYALVLFPLFLFLGLSDIVQETGTVKLGKDGKTYYLTASTPPFLGMTIYRLETDSDKILKQLKDFDTRRTWVKVRGQRLKDDQVGNYRIHISDIMESLK